MNALRQLKSRSNLAPAAGWHQICKTESALTLIIRDQLVCPPTWFASYRDLTLYCHILLRMDIVIESEAADLYYRWIKPKGGMDFIEDFVRPGSEEGTRLDVARAMPRTIVTDRIAPENVHRLIAGIRALAAGAGASRPGPQ